MISNHLMRCLVFLLLVALLAAEKCPFWGEFDCPKNFACVLGTCKDAKEQLPPTECSEVDCGPDAMCVKDGRCLAFEGLPCGRNALIANNSARAVVSDCGWKGKCLNGRCVKDRCYENLCKDEEICRDGTCVKLVDSLCFSHFDCGAKARCIANKCAAPDTLASFTPPRCDPGETYTDHKCEKSEGCDRIVCSVGESCVEGVCVPLAIDCKTDPCPAGTICGSKNTCEPDPCLEKPCPQEHACFLGECRLIQGLICRDHCAEPFECIDGKCAKNECRRKVCQIGERCENGICVHIENNFCSLAPRDCGPEFECIDGKCRDTISSFTSTVPTGNITIR